MKILIEEISEQPEVEIIIRCAQIDDTVQQLLASLRAAEKKLVGEKNGRSFVFGIDEVFYFESVDKKTFLYTEKEVYETPMRLYEIEERFAGSDFFRASKSLIINLARVKVLYPSISGKVEVTLENKEHLYVSRQYVPRLKEKLGM